MSWLTQSTLRQLNVWFGDAYTALDCWYSSKLHWWVSHGCKDDAFPFFSDLGFEIKPDDTHEIRLKKEANEKTRQKVQTLKEEMKERIKEEENERKKGNERRKNK